MTAYNRNTGERRFCSVESGWNNGKHCIRIVFDNGEVIPYVSLQMMSREWKLTCDDDDPSLIPTRKTLDERLEHLWDLFGDVPMNEDTECIEKPFIHFPDGTFREDIWHWFDDRHSKGVHYLLYEYEGS